MRGTTHTLLETAAEMIVLRKNAVSCVKGPWCLCGELLPARTRTVAEKMVKRYACSCGNCGKRVTCPKGHEQKIKGYTAMIEDITAGKVPSCETCQIPLTKFCSICLRQACSEECMIPTKTTSDKNVFAPLRCLGCVEPREWCPSCTHLEKSKQRAAALENREFFSSTAIENVNVLHSTSHKTVHGLALDAEQRRLAQHNKRGIIGLRVRSSEQFARTLNRRVTNTPRVGYPEKLPLKKEDFTQAQM